MTLSKETRNKLSDEALAFAEQHTPLHERWAYCLSRMTVDWFYADGSLARRELNERAFPACNRFLNSGNNRYRLRMLHKARDIGAVNARLESIGTKPLAVGPMQPWLVGHVYFVRVASHPHVIKVGFSRRVADRIEDIQSTYKVELVEPITKVGTQADEAWWHNNWSKRRIAGEWFFEPESERRDLPHFLQNQQERAA